jgi:pimeloyl-ACP methyl ester carboxylesterase
MAHRVNDIVLVHGGFVDGSGWGGVYRILENDGFNVSIVQNPTLSLEGDVAATKLIIDQQPGDVILVGHSYGGAVITQAGTHAKADESEVPWGVEALGGMITTPAWKSKPSWYLLVTDDHMIPLAAQRFMCERAGATPAEVPGSHAIYVSNPSAVAALIKTAALSQQFASV